MAASTPTPLAVKRVPAPKPHTAPPTDNQPLSDENVNASNPPTTPTETETTQGTTFTEATANPVPPKIRRPFRSDPLLKEKELTRSPDSVFNKASTVTTTATTGAGSPTGGWQPAAWWLTWCLRPEGPARRAADGRSHQTKQADVIP